MYMGSYAQVRKQCTHLAYESSFLVDAGGIRATIIIEGGGLPITGPHQRLFAGSLKYVAARNICSSPVIIPFKPFNATRQ